MTPHQSAYKALLPCLLLFLWSLTADVALIRYYVSLKKKKINKNSGQHAYSLKNKKKKQCLYKLGAWQDAWACSLSVSDSDTASPRLARLPRGAQSSSPGRRPTFPPQPSSGSPRSESGCCRSKLLHCACASGVPLRSKLSEESRVARRRSALTKVQPEGGAGVTEFSQALWENSHQVYGWISKTRPDFVDVIIPHVWY